MKKLKAFFLSLALVAVLALPAWAARTWVLTVSSNPEWRPTSLPSVGFILESWRDSLTIADTTKVTSWLDQSANALDFVKTNDATRPARNATGTPNGLATVDVNRSDKTGLVNSTTVMRNDTAFTFVLVFYATGITDYDAIFTLKDGAASVPLTIALSNQPGYSTLYVWSGPGGFVNFRGTFSNPTNQWNMLVLKNNGLGKNTLSNFSASVNGSALTLSSVAAAGAITNRNVVGHYSPGEQYCATARIAGAYFGNADWSASELTRLKDYINTKIGTSF